MATQPKKKETPKMAESLPAVVEEKTPAPISYGAGGVAIPQDMEDELLADAGLGSENMGTQDRQIPYIRIVQSLSPQRQKAKPEYIPGADEGMIYNSVTGELSTAEEGIIVVPVSYIRRYTEWWPRDSKLGKGLVADHGSDESVVEKLERTDRGNWATAKGTEITVSGDFIVLVVSETMDSFYPALISMGGAQLKKSRIWNTRLTTERVNLRGKLILPPIWYRTWKLTTKAESNDQGSWYGWVIEPGLSLMEIPLGKTLYSEAKIFRASVDSGEIKVAADNGESSARGPVVDQSGRAVLDEGEDAPF